MGFPEGEKASGRGIQKYYLGIMDTGNALYPHTSQVLPQSRIVLMPENKEGYMFVIFSSIRSANWWNPKNRAVMWQGWSFQIQQCPLYVDSVIASYGFIREIFGLD